MATRCPRRRSCTAWRRAFCARSRPVHAAARIAGPLFVVGIPSYSIPSATLPITACWLCYEELCNTNPIRSALSPGHFPVGHRRPFQACSRPSPSSLGFSRVPLGAARALSRPRLAPLSRSSTPSFTHANLGQTPAPAGDPDTAWSPARSSTGGGPQAAWCLGHAYSTHYYACPCVKAPLTSLRPSASSNIPSSPTARSAACSRCRPPLTSLPPFAMVPPAPPSNHHSGLFHSFVGFLIFNRHLRPFSFPRP